MGCTVTGFGGELPSLAMRPELQDTRSHTIWQDVNTRLALIPLLFIRVSGKVDLAPGPIAFRFTAMEGVL